MSLLYVPLQILLISVDFIITLVTFQWINAIRKALQPAPLRTIPVGGVEYHRCHPRFKDYQAKLDGDGPKTLYELTRQATEQYAKRPCMGKRQFKGWKTPKIKEFGAKVDWITYKQMDAKMHKFGAALRAAGCVSAPHNNQHNILEKLQQPSRIAIFENTCPEWMIAAMGAFTQSISVATVYATLGLDAVAEAINDSMVPVIVCNKSNVASLVKNIHKMKSLKTIIYTNDLVPPNSDIEIPAVAPEGVTIISFDDFVDSGDTANYPAVPPKPDTTAVIMYTSGSTAKPKGVVITHKHIVNTIASAEYLIQLTDQDKYLAYLPLAHILEMMVEFVVISSGCCLCYADPKSLTTTGAHPIGALEQFKPTLMVGVPKIWDTIKKGVQAKISKQPAIARVVARTGIQWRTFATKYGFDTPLFNALVFNKLKQAVGGDLRWALSGGGPLSGEVQDFIRVVFGFPLCQGYGLTETTAGVAIQADDDLRHGVQGVAFPCAEVKLESTPDLRDKSGAPYMCIDTKDIDGNDIFGRGEICVRGSHVSAGYYMMPEKTKEEYGDDGWFHTGDVGQFMSDGSIRIVDRKKNLVKLKSGEYIAIEKMEMVYGNSDFVDTVAGGVCCYGDGDMDRPVALVQLSKSYTTDWAKQNNISGDFEALLTSEEVYQAVMKSMKEQHSKSDLSHLEKLIAVALLNSPWTPENGCLTAANKLQRRVVVEQFSKEFEEVKKKGVFA